MSGLLLIDNYDSFTFNLYQMLQEQTEAKVSVYRNDALTFDELLALKPDGVVLSPGPGHPAASKDFGICQAVIEQWDRLNVPVLGVCLGHQGLGCYMGGQVSQAPAIMHGKTSQVAVLRQDSPLFAGLPNPFTAMRYHSLVVSEENFPHETFRITAKDLDHGLIMAMEHRSKPLYGVQFHPESIGTPEGGLMLKNFLTLCKLTPCPITA
jgi:anthranilate synthase component II